MPIVKFPSIGASVTVPDNLNEEQINSLVQSKILPQLQAEYQRRQSEKRKSIESERSQIQPTSTLKQFPSAVVDEALISGANPVNWPAIISNTVGKVVGEETLQRNAETAKEIGAGVADWIGNKLWWGDTGKGTLEGAVEQGASLVLNSPQLLPALPLAANPVTAVPVLTGFTMDLLGGSKAYLEQANLADEAGDKRQAASLRMQAALGIGMAVAPFAHGVAKADIIPKLEEIRKSAEFEKALGLQTEEKAIQSAFPKRESELTQPKLDEQTPAVTEGTIGETKQTKQAPRTNVERNVTPVQEEIPLGMSRDPVVNNDLRGLSEEQFEAQKIKAGRNVDKLESRMDDKTSLREDQNFRRQLAEAQDVYDSFENETFRRDVMTLHPEEVALELRRLNTKSKSGKVKAALIAEAIQKRGIHDEIKSAISEKIKDNNDFAEIYDYTLKEVGNVVETIGKEQKVKIPEERRLEYPERKAVEELNPIREQSAEVPAEPKRQENPVIDITPESQVLRIYSGPGSDVVKSVDSLMRRYGTKEQGLAKGPYQALEASRGFEQVQFYRVRVAAKNLDEAIKEEYGIKGHQRLDPRIIRQLNNILHSPPASGLYNTLPKRLRKPMRQMRRHVSELSNILLRENLVNDDMKAIIRNNLDVYLNRSYRAYHEKGHVWDSIDPQVKRDAIDLMKQDILDYVTDKVNRGVDTPEDHARVADLEQSAINYLKAWLQDIKDKGDQPFGGGRKLMAKETSMFKRRKDIPEQYRKFLGEYEDPFVSYPRTIGKMANYIANIRFQRAVLADGMGKYLFDPKGTRPPGFDHQIEAGEGSIVKPLAGLRTDAFHKAVFDEFGKLSEIGIPQKLLLAASSYSKLSKIVLNLPTQMRNLIGQLGFWLHSGNWNPAAFFTKQELEPGGVKTTPLNAAFRVIVNELTAKPNKEYDAFTKKMIQLGLVNDSVIGTEIRDMLKSASTAMRDQSISPVDVTQGWAAKTGRALKSVQSGIAKAYQVPDSFGKVVGFMLESRKLKKARPGWSERMIDAEAAERVKNTYPTFSRMPKWARQMQRNVPVVGFVMGFQTETIRTSTWNLLYGLEDLAEGIKTGNKALTASGASRIAGSAAMHTILPLAAQFGSQWLNGISKEDDREFRELGADYSKDDTLMYLGKDGINPVSINLSYLNPYTTFDSITAAIRAARDGGNVADAVLAFADRQLRPFFEDTPLQKSLIEAKSGVKEQGGKRTELWNNQMTQREIIAKQFEHIWNYALSPGSIRWFQSTMLPKLRGEKGGNPGLELFSHLTGIKVQTQDLMRDMGFKASAFVEATDNISGNYRNRLWGNKSITPEQFVQEYMREENERFEQWDRMYGKINALRHQGVDDDQISALLKKRGVGQAAARSLMEGEYVPYKLPKDFEKQSGITIPDAIRDIEYDRRDLILTRGVK